jgi:hypothetical protein
MMTEFVLEEVHWPATMSEDLRAALRSAVSRLRTRSELLGLAAGGSFASGEMDEFSDLDLFLVVAPPAWAEPSESRRAIAQSLGPLLLAFKGEHVGEPDMLICLYGPPLVHVELHFVTPERFCARPDRHVVLWDREGRLRAAGPRGLPPPAPPDWQWIEDRFWHWVRYVAAKIGRAELFEALRILGDLRSRVLGPLALHEAGAPAYGVKKIERTSPDRAKQMRATVAAYDADDIVRAMRATIAMYRSFRDRAPADLHLRSGAEVSVEKYFAAVAERVERRESPATEE